MLWVLALMLGSMGSFNSGGGSSGNDSNFNNQNQYQEQQDRPSNLVGMVLGDSSVKPDFDTFISQTVASVGSSNIMVLGFSVLVFIVFSVFVSLFTQSWAYGAFLGGIDDAIAEREYVLNDLGRYGRRSTREILRYRLLFVIAGVVVLAVVLAAGISAYLAKDFVLLGVAMLLLTPVFILVFILSLGNNFALRFIALKGMSAFDAIKAGLKMFFNNLIKIVVLAVTNCLVVSALMLVVLGVVVGGLMGLILPGTLINFESLNPAIFTSLIVLLIPVLFVLIGLFMVVGAFLTTYKNFTWSMFFNFMSQGDQKNGTK